MPENSVPDVPIPIRSTFPSAFAPPPPPPPPPGQLITVVGESIRVARCECKDCQAHAASQETYLRLKFSDYREIDPTQEAGLTEHQYSIFPSHMFGFVLNDRTYGTEQ